VSLFEEHLKSQLQARGPLAARLRPRRLDDVVGQDHLLGPGAPLRALVEARRLTSLIFWGPAGTGKTSVARLLAEAVGASFEPLSATSAGVKDVREAAERARRRASEQAQQTVLMLDEVHRFSRSQQDALLPGVEEGIFALVGTTTENPFFEINGPLLSRSVLLRFEPLDQGASQVLIERALATEKASITPEATEALVRLAGGDGRALLTTLEVALAMAGSSKVVELGHVERAQATRSLTWGRDDHYDVTSALIKSIRGSDPDASLHWLARMVQAGEDPRFIARRLVVAASEDVGMADPTSLLVATAAAHAVELVGLPEAALNLAQAVVHLACAPKSNSTAKGIWQAMEDVRARRLGPVPPHLRDGHYAGAALLGHGSGYRYPHDYPRAWVNQVYLPEELAHTVYYRPSDQGAEAEVAQRLFELARRSREDSKDAVDQIVTDAKAGPGHDGPPEGAAHEPA